MPNQRRQDPVEYGPRLTDRQKELMMTVLLRDTAAFVSVRTQLQPKHFGRDDRRFALVWNAACELFDEFHELPEEEQLAAEVDRRLTMVDDEFSEEELEALDEFLGRAFAVEPKAIKTRYGVAKAKQFIQDAMAAEVSDLTADWSRERPVLLGRLLSDFTQKLQDVEALDTDDEDDEFPENWTPKSLAKKTTNVAFWNAFMNGGQAGGEVYGLLGPFGSCKTTLMVQTAVEACIAATDEWIAAGRPGLCPFRVYFASYEESREEIRMRFLGYAAQVLRDRLEELKTWDHLEAENLLPYERNRFAQALRNNLPVPTERRRAMAALKRLNRCLKVYDMTTGGRGTGLADELSGLVQADQQRKGNPGVRGVFIDYAGAAVERYLDARDLDRKEMRSRLKAFPLHCKQKIAVPYETSVWVAHQLSGMANAKGSAQVQHHTDAAENKSFAENLAFCFTVGVKDQTTNMCVLAKTKGRRAAGSPTRVIRVEGELWRVTDQSHLYAVDPVTSRIASIRDLSRVQETRPIAGARTHDVASQFNLAEIAGMPGDEDEPPRRLARRQRREET